MTGWMLDPDVAYLNHGAFGALPNSVWDAAVDLRAMMERNPANLLARTLAPALADIREQLAHFLGADEAGCVFVPNATAGTATVLTALAPTFDTGDEILTTDHRYGAVAVQLDVVGATTGTTPVYAHVPLNVMTVADIVTAITDRVTDRTRLLVIDSIASASGFKFPVADIVAAAHDRGVPVLVDAAHAPGQIDVDLTAIGADFWVGNLHKWVCSPRAAAIMFVAPQWRHLIRPLVASHFYADGLQPAFDWTGTLDPVTLLAVPAALAFWADLGWDPVRKQQSALVDAGAQHVANALGTTSPVADEFRAAMRVVELPVNVTYEQARRIELELSQTHHVEVSLMALHDRAWVRVCGQIYNTSADYERLATALPDLLEA